MNARYAHRRLVHNETSVMELGDGPPIVLLHGVGLCADVWRPQCAELASDYRLVCPDLPGHGASKRLTGTPTLAGLADPLSRMLSARIDAPMVLVGHSLGALIAFELARRATLDIRGLVLISSVFERSLAARQAVQRRARALSSERSNTDETLARWFGQPPKHRYTGAVTEARRWLTASARHGYADAYHVFAQQPGPSRDHLAAFGTKALVLTGEEDPNSTPQMARAMAEALPFGCAHVVSGAAHMVTLTHAAECNEVLSEFCRQC